MVFCWRKIFVAVAKRVKYGRTWFTKDYCNCFDQYNKSVDDADVSGAITKPDGTTSNITFNSQGNGIYGGVFLFEDIGTYKVEVSASRYDMKNIFGSIYSYVGVGLVQLVEFSTIGDRTVYQNNNMYFYLDIKKLANMTNETIDINIEILNSDGVVEEINFNHLLSDTDENQIVEHVWYANSKPGSYTAHATIYYFDNSGEHKNLPREATNFIVKSPKRVGGEVQLVMEQQKR